MRHLSHFVKIDDVGLAKEEWLKILILLYFGLGGGMSFFCCASRSFEISSCQSISWSLLIVAKDVAADEDKDGDDVDTLSMLFFFGFFVFFYFLSQGRKISERNVTRA